MKAAIGGKLGCLDHLIAKGAKLEATNNVSAARPAAPPDPFAPRSPPSPPATPAAPHPRRSPPTTTACAVTAAPSQAGNTALMLAAGNGKLDCLELLIAKGADLNALSKVRLFIYLSPRALLRCGEGCGGLGGRMCAPQAPATRPPAAAAHPRVGPSRLGAGRVYSAALRG